MHTSRGPAVETPGTLAGRQTGLVEINGVNSLIVEALRAPLLRALAGRRAFYAVHVTAANQLGEVLVSITGRKGRLPLLFARDELEPGYVFGLVSATVDRFGF